MEPAAAPPSVAPDRGAGAPAGGAAVLEAAAPRTLAVPTVVGIGTALPPDRGQREIWDTFFGEHYGNRAAPEQIFMNSGVETRHAAVDPRVEDVANWGTEQRMKRFLEEAMPLGRAAIEACLQDARLAPADVGQLTVVSCTGYATPGLDVLLARELGLGLDAQRLHIGHMGCYAAVPGLATVADGVAARGRVSIMLCLELTSLHVQPPTRDLEQVVAHALFSDAATAVAVAPDAAAGLEVVDVVARTDTDHREKMRWDVTDQGFRMALSSKVPVVLEQHVEAVVDDLLAPRGLRTGDARPCPRASRPCGGRRPSRSDADLGWAGAGCATSADAGAERADRPCPRVGRTASLAPPRAPVRGASRCCRAGVT